MSSARATRRPLRDAPAVALLATLLASRDAGAFCRTTTVKVEPSFQPSERRCWDQGVPLFWRNSCVGYNVQRDASRQVTLAEATGALASAFSKWTSASCVANGAGRSRVSIDVRDLGPVDCAVIDYNQTGANQNVIVFRDDAWPHDDSNNTLALTTVTFSPETGEIYDADMEINTHDQQVALRDPIPGDGYDFASILTHEAGHFLGMAHSGDSHATMFANYTPGATAMRELAADDVKGICTVYSPDGNRAVMNDKVTAGPSCDPTPRRGFTGTCAEPAKKSCTGASQVAASSPVGPGALASVVAPIALVLARRRRTTV